VEVLIEKWFWVGSESWQVVAEGLVFEGIGYGL
jgi:hypothetical protein